MTVSSVKETQLFGYKAWMRRQIRGMINFWNEYKKSKFGMVGLGILVFFILFALAAPFFAPTHPDWRTGAFPHDFKVQYAAPEFMQLISPDPVGEHQYFVDSGKFESADSINGDLASGNFKPSIENPDSSVSITYEIATPPKTVGDDASLHSGKALHVTFKDTSTTSNQRVKIKFTGTFKWHTTALPKRVDVIISSLFKEDADSENSGMDKLFQIEYTFKNEKSSSDLGLGVGFKTLGSSPYPTIWQRHSKSLDIFERLNTFKEPATVQFTIEITYKGDEAPAAFGTAEFYLDNLLIWVHSSYEGILGTDNLGQDLLSLLMYGTWVSFAVGILSTVFALIIGVSVGMISGYSGGWLDEIIMRFVDFLIIMPGLPLLIVLAAVLHPSFWNIIIIIAFLGWGGGARLIRSQVLVEKEKAYVESAKAAGAGDLYIVFRHILPNVVPILFAQAATGVSGAILSEAGLSFLGLGDPVAPSWGKILQRAFNTNAITKGAWWVVTFPGIAIMMMSMAFVLIGYNVNEIINPRLRTR